MPVDDIEVHEKVRKTDFRAGCYNREGVSDGYWAPNRVYRPDGSYTMSETWVPNTMTKTCRQIGRRVAMDWFDLP